MLVTSTTPRATALAAISSSSASRFRRGQLLVSGHMLTRLYPGDSHGNQSALERRSSLDRFPSCYRRVPEAGIRAAPVRTWLGGSAWRLKAAGAVRGLGVTGSGTLATRVWDAKPSQCLRRLPHTLTPRGSFLFLKHVRDNADVQTSYRFRK